MVIAGIMRNFCIVLFNRNMILLVAETAFLWTVAFCKSDKLDSPSFRWYQSWKSRLVIKLLRWGFCGKQSSADVGSVMSCHGQIFFADRSGACRGQRNVWCLRYNRKIFGVQFVSDCSVKAHGHVYWQTFPFWADVGLEASFPVIQAMSWKVKAVK